MKKLALAGAALAMTCAFSATAFSAEPIVGNWKRSNGTVIKYSGSGSRYCGKVMTGEYKNQSIGCMNGNGADYKGEVKKLDEGKTYTGKATVSGNSMKLSGCVLGGIICKSETLMRQ